MAVNQKLCDHLSAIEDIKMASAHKCVECAKIGGHWVHLRICQACGLTLCCDSSPNRHATAHFHQTGHPVVASGEPGEHWLWCYEDRQFVEY
jgi:3-deoxy-D-manno-octulosonate 8-phosphate phosphatase KdsC-like HAD superfamily phosphatase